MGTPILHEQAEFRPDDVDPVGVDSTRVSFFFAHHQAICIVPCRGR